MCLGLNLSVCKDDHDPTPAGKDAVNDKAVDPGLPAPMEPPNDWSGDGIHSPHDITTEDDQEDTGRVQLSVDHCPEADCPVRVRFTQAMVDASALEDAKVPEIVFNPKIKGEWAWQSDRELVFTPNEGELLWGNNINIEIPKLTPLAGTDHAMSRAIRWAYRVPNLQITPKVAAYWNVIRGQPRYVGVLNGGSEQIGHGPLLLAYDQKINAMEVQKRLQIKTQGEKPIEFRAYRPTELNQSYSGDLPNHYFVAIQPKGDLEEGQELTVEVPTWKDGELSHQEFHVSYTSKFSLMDSGFYLNRWEAPLQDPLPHYVQLKLEFDRGFSAAALEEHLSITPEPESMDIRGGWGTAWVHLVLDPGTEYEAKTTREFTDLLGNPLTQQVHLRFRSKDLPPLLTTPSLPTLVERDRGHLSVRGRNVGKIQGKVVAFASPEAFARALERGSTPSCQDYGARGQRQDLEPVPFPEERNVVHEVGIKLPKTGLACIELTARGLGTEASGNLAAAALIQTAVIGVTAKVSTDSVFAWVTRLAKPTPIKGATVRLLDSRGSTLSQGTTDDSGVATLDAGELASRGGVGQSSSIVVEAEGETAVVQLAEDKLSNAWQFGLEGTAGDPLFATIFTDRGAYRPGEEMHAKVIVGPAPWLTDQKVEAEIRDSRGQQIAKKDLKLDAYGSADLDLALKDGAPVGAYSIAVTAGARSATRSFKVEEYRVPTFQVRVRGGQWMPRQKAQARIQAKYMHGGALSGRTMRWELIREPHVFSPGAFPRYVFALGSTMELAGPVAGGERLLDDEGTQLIGFVPDHPSSAGPMLYRLEASVTDVDRQAYSGRLTRIVPPADFYVGVLPPSRNILSEKERSTGFQWWLSVPSGSAVRGVEVRVRLEAYGPPHNSARQFGGRCAVAQPIC